MQVDERLAHHRGETSAESVGWTDGPLMIPQTPTTADMLPRAARCVFAPTARTVTDGRRAAHLAFARPPLPER
jgi:hypothetical protein